MQTNCLLCKSQTRVPKQIILMRLKRRSLHKHYVTTKCAGMLFLNLKNILWCIVLNQWFSKWVDSLPWGRFWWARGRKTQGVDGGAKQHKGGENAQLLIDHWANFSSLLLWFVSFLQILIYYDKIFGCCC